MSRNYRSRARSVAHAVTLSSNLRRDVRRLSGCSSAGCDWNEFGLGLGSLLSWSRRWRRCWSRRWGAVGVPLNVLVKLPLRL